MFTSDQLKNFLTGPCAVTFPVHLLVVGVSGGTDSMCLLDALARFETSLLVVHVDHQLRDHSAADARFVAREAEKRGLRYLIGKVDAQKAADEMNQSLEEAARIARYRFLFDTARNERADAVVVAHTADDQVETVLMHLLRGSGLSGLRGMAHRSVLKEWDERVPLLRPLLGVWRENLEAYRDFHHLEVVEDESNLDTRFFRNRLRHELIPLLATYNPQIKQSLWRMADTLSGDYDLVVDTMESIWADVVKTEEEKQIAFDASRVKALPRGARRNLLRRAISVLRPALRDIGYQAVEAAASFIDEPSRSGHLTLVEGVELFLVKDQLVVNDGEGRIELSSEYPQLQSMEQVILSLSDQVVPLSDGWRLRIWIEDVDLDMMDIDQLAADEAWMDLDQIQEPLVLRARRPGDRIMPLGMGGHSMKLSDFFVNEKLPRFARGSYPLVCGGDDIYWVPGMRRADYACISLMTHRVLGMKVEQVST
ncbi:MAG: tRNA lysidine(34) synthetase TilS [Anaerolineaceae bacterium]|nr:tRNA lysidine(34) synthetase TilS [Anaerolineaceae bacterium]